MKANLLIDGTEVLAGYTNIDPFAKEGDGKVKGDISNLDHSFDDDELEEIIADSVLEYYGVNMIGNVLKNWIVKLQKGGRLVITVPDIYEIARAIMRRDISEDDANVLLFGPQDDEAKTKKNAFSMEKVEYLLTYLNMKVITKRFNAFKLVIVAEKL